MKNLFEKETVEEILSRINRLQPASPRQWGKMDVAQMLAHCANTMDMACGAINPPRIFIGRLLGPLVRPMFVNEKPFSKNSPTDHALRIADQRDFVREQQRLKDGVLKFNAGGEANCTRHPHPFFGAIPPQVWARGMYKHLDHHLRQFAV